MTDFRMPLIVKQNDCIIRLLAGETSKSVMDDYYDFVQAFTKEVGSADIPIIIPKTFVTDGISKENVS